LLRLMLSLIHLFLRQDFTNIQTVFGHKKSPAKGGAWEGEARAI